VPFFLSSIPLRYSLLFFLHNLFQKKLFQLNHYHTASQGLEALQNQIALRQQEKDDSTLSNEEEAESSK
jgi:hypothetical protein